MAASSSIEVQITADADPLVREVRRARRELARLQAARSQRLSPIATLLFVLSLGMGLGRSLEDWPGPIAASLVPLVLAVAALVLTIRDLRKPTR